MKSILAVSVMAALLVCCGEERLPRATDGASLASQSTGTRASVSSSKSAESAMQDSAVAFVRDFYAWYTPKVQDVRESAAALVLRERASALAPDLREALRVDEARQRRSEGEIVSLDFDPFTASQDPCQHYETGEASRVATSVRVAVYSVCSGVRVEKPTLTAEVVRAGGGWAFANFYYDTTTGDLRTILRQLADTTSE